MSVIVTTAIKVRNRYRTNMIVTNPVGGLYNQVNDRVTSSWKKLMVLISIISVLNEFVKYVRGSKIKMNLKHTINMIVDIIIVDEDRVNISFEASLVT